MTEQWCTETQRGDAYSLLCQLAPHELLVFGRADLQAVLGVLHGALAFDVIQRECGVRGARFATHVEALLRAAKDTKFRSRPIVFAPAQQKLYVDCSAFVDEALALCPDARAFVRLHDVGNRGRPYAADFVSALERAVAQIGSSNQPQTPPWRRIGRLADALPGDVLAWRNPTGSDSGGHTGHVVVVRETPTTTPTDVRANVQGDLFMRVLVIDSAKIGNDEGVRARAMFLPWTATVDLQLLPNAKKMASSNL